MKIEISKPVAHVVHVASGLPGKSAYAAAVEAGFEGTLEEWLDWLEGANVTTGAGSPTVDGRKPGQPYINAETGDVYEWSGTTWTLVGSIKGDKGDAGDPGEPGPPGQDGEKGDPGIGVPTTGNQTGDLMRWNGSVWTQTATKFFEGTGDPNGVVTAPVGSTFVNTETGGYNGARRWTKATGTGNTGWVVVDGDTGWADIQAYLTADWVKQSPAWATCEIRRVNGDVQFRFTLQSTKTSGNVNGTVNVFTGLPVAWRPSASVITTGAAGYFGSPNGPATFSFSGSGWSARGIGIAGTYTESTQLNGSFTIPTTDAWPSTLP